MTMKFTTVLNGLPSEATYALTLADLSLGPRPRKVPRQAAAGLLGEGGTAAPPAGGEGDARVGAPLLSVVVDPLGHVLVGVTHAGRNLGCIYSCDFSHE